MSFSPADIDRVRRFWNAPGMATREGLKAVDVFAAIERGAVKALWVMATNPAVSLARAGAFRAALNKLELFVVSETTLRNDTVEAGAHVLLPAAAWGEKDGTVTNSERRVSRQRAFLPRPGEAQSDWWIVSEVARRLGFAGAFDYRTPADIFREHAALSAFENDGARDFDLGGLAGLTDADYEGLDSVMWPLPVSGERGERRFFAAGGFFTSDRRGRFVAPEFPQLRAPVSEAFPLRLNTGRLRDQWHTMTRTGQSPRLGAHSPEPQIDIHPQDAAAAGLEDGGFARVSSQHGSAVLRVCVRSGQQRGSIFAPIHWSSATASDACVGALAMADTDPLSGQPELKATPARVEPVEFAYRGFVLTREPVALPRGTWFARVAVAGGHGLLFATNALPIHWRGLAEQLIAGETERAEYIDLPRGIVRIAAFRDGRIEACIFCGPAQNSPRWEIVRALFDTGVLAERDRRLLLSGRSAEGMAETGPIVCACFGVGLEAIRRAITQGTAVSVAEIGRALRAGTNCGSCIPELQGIVERAAAAAVENRS
jgi:assimilatory nitrate reductase catalytic subunit